MKLHKFLMLLFFLPQAVLASVEDIQSPQIVGVPPADAGRGLVRVSDNEIRHYNGGEGYDGRKMLVSNDNGVTWQESLAPSSYPPNFGGIAIESPAITPNPITGEYIRVQPINGYVFISNGGLDGEWAAVTKDGQLDYNWDQNDKENYLTLSGIMRNPTFVNNGKRILIPSHEMREGTTIHISDDGGLTWRTSKDIISAPPHEKDEIHQGVRWRNSGVEGSIVELKDGRLWILVRTSQDQYYEAFSSDFGDTWTESQPSRFFGTLTMPTIGRLKDGRLLALWTNTMPLPEHQGTQDDMWEDVFTNRDSHHAAISNNDGKTWTGFREIILDEHRNSDDYALFEGKGDRGKQQSEFVELDENRVLVSIGQHKEHRRLMILDTRWLYQKKRSDNFKNGLENWTIHSYIPEVRGHVSYDRKPSSELVTLEGKPTQKALQIRRASDAELINIENNLNYEKGGATWNFPNGKKGRVDFRFKLNKHSGGTQISLTDRLFNAVDETTAHYAVYTLNLAPGEKLGKHKLRPNRWYTLSLDWNGVKKNSTVRVLLDGKQADRLKIKNTSPNGISYLHFISTSQEPDEGMLIRSVKASVK
ncbi:sialidase family protein [Photobacterium rosenbergii]|uniref:sialidase family protein n=1 Tax=Photobacterium rosenbergii TaxID=294936 RepID=UPI001C99FDE5|nr:sialidase family protein [Photobacterium rosenbergii]MBY5944185.1 glycoside hydrolase [Photobacterium rosenbergii]